MILQQIQVLFLVAMGRKLMMQLLFAPLKIMFPGTDFLMLDNGLDQTERRNIKWKDIREIPCPFRT